MPAISTEELYQCIRANPRYWEAVNRFFRYGELPAELEGQHFPNLERAAAEIKRRIAEREAER